jgi:hypothetical protein
MRSLEHLTVLRYTAGADKMANIIGQYLAGLSNSLSTTISTLSIVQRSLEYKKQDRHALGRHFQVTSDGRAEAFPVIGENSAPSTTWASSLRASVGIWRSLLRLKMFGTSSIVPRIRRMCWVGVSRPSRGWRCEAP